MSVAFEIDLAAIAALPPEEREVAMAEIRELQREFARNPLYRFLPHEGERQWKLEKGIPLTGDESRGQVAVLESDRYETACVAGNRYGKTEIGAVRALVNTVPRHLLPPWLLPYRRRDEGREWAQRVVGVDVKHWLNKAMLPKLRKLIPQEALLGGHWQSAWRERELTLWFADGSWWDFLTHDMDIDAYASAELDSLWVDEEPPGERGKQQFEESEMRLIDREGDITITMTPLFGFSFLYHELTDTEGNPRDDDECLVVVGDMDHNPHLSDEARARALRKAAKDPLKLKARKSGLWVHFAGMVYEEWSEADHVIPDRADLPRAEEGAKPSVPVFEAIDPGIAVDHPAAFSAAYLLPDDTLEVFHTHKIWGGTAEDMAKHIHEVRAALDYKPRWTVIDPKARSKDHQTGKSTQDAYRKHGIKTIAGQNDVQLGINAVKERLKTDRIKFWRDGGAHFIEEVPRYRWKGNKRSGVEDAAAPKVIKRDDDTCDTVRYLVVQLPRPRREREEEAEPRSNAERLLRDSLRHVNRRRRRGRRIGGVMPR